MLEEYKIIGIRVLKTFLYTIAVVLYSLSSRYLLVRQRRNMLMFSYVSLVVGCGLFLVALSSWPGFVSGPSGIGLFDEKSASPTSPGPLAQVLTELVLNIPTVIMKIWRLCVIWNRSPYLKTIAILQTMLLCAYVGIQLALFVILLGQISLSEHTQFILVAAGRASDLASTLFVTLFILLRIVLVRNRQDRYTKYTSVSVMIMESFAIDTVWTHAGFIFTYLNRRSLEPARILFVSTADQIRIIVQLVVVYRIVTDQGWGSDTEIDLTSLSTRRSFVLESLVGDDPRPTSPSMAPPSYYT